MSGKSLGQGLSLKPALILSVIVSLLLLFMGVVTALTREPWVFPSLGASVLILIGAPDAPPASTRNTVSSHFIGIACGSFALVVCGLLSTAPSLDNVGSGRLAAIALASGLTALLMLRFGVPHPPAMSTTLIVALGLIRTPQGLAIMALAVVLLVALARIVNYLRGYRLPWWSVP